MLKCYLNVSKRLSVTKKVSDKNGDIITVLIMVMTVIV